MTTRVTIRNMKHAFSATAGETELEVHSGGVKKILPPGEEAEFYVEGEEGLKVKERKVKEEKPEDPPQPEPIGATSRRSPGLADPYPQPSGASRK